MKLPRSNLQLCGYQICQKRQSRLSETNGSSLQLLWSNCLRRLRARLFRTCGYENILAVLYTVGVVSTLIVFNVFLVVWDLKQHYPQTALEEISQNFTWMRALCELHPDKASLTKHVCREGKKKKRYKSVCKCNVHLLSVDLLPHACSIIRSRTFKV